MNCKEIVREIMQAQNVTNATLADRLKITQAALWDRLKLKKTIKGEEVSTPNISVDKLNDILRCLDYELVIVPRGKSGKISGAFLVEDTEEKK